MIDLCIEIQHTAVFPDDPLGDREAKAGTFLFGSEESVAQMALDLLGDACTCVLDLDNDHLGLAVAQHCLVLTSAQVNGPPMADAFGRVLDQVDEHPLKLVRIGTEPHILHRVNLQFDRIFRKLEPEKITNLPKRAFGRHWDKAGFWHIMELQKIFEDRVETPNLFADYRRVFVFAGPFGKRLLKGVEAQVNGG